MTCAPPVTVLFSLPSLEGEDAEVVLTLLQHLDRRRIAPHLALVNTTSERRKAVPDDVPTTDLGGCGPQALLHLLRLIWRLRPDVVFSSVSRHATLVLLLKRLSPAGTRFMLRESGHPSVELAATPFAGLRRWLYATARRQADRIICQSEAMVSDVASEANVAGTGVPQNSLLHIANPLDIDEITDAMPRPNPYAGKGRRLVTAGRLIPVKGFDMLLTAFAKLCESHDNLNLHILGEGPEEAALRRQRDGLGLNDRVVFEGFKADPLPYFEHADLFVMSSRYETFPNVTLKALACGTPVVAFDTPGGTPVLDGVNGWLVPNGDVDALAVRMGEGLIWLPIPEDALLSTIFCYDLPRVVAAYEKLFKP